MKLNSVQSTLLKYISYTGPLDPQSTDDPEWVEAFNSTNVYISDCLAASRIEDFTPEFLAEIEKKYESLPHPGRVAVMCGALATCERPGGVNHIPVLKAFHKAVFHAFLEVFGQKFDVPGVEVTWPKYLPRNQRSPEEKYESVHTDSELQELRERAAAYAAKKEATASV